MAEFKWVIPAKNLWLWEAAIADLQETNLFGYTLDLVRVEQGLHPSNLHLHISYQSPTAILLLGMKIGRAAQEGGPADG